MGSSPSKACSPLLAVYGIYRFVVRAKQVEPFIEG